MRFGNILEKKQKKTGGGVRTSVNMPVLVYVKDKINRMDLKDKDSLQEAITLLNEMKAVDKEKGHERFMAYISRNRKSKQQRLWTRVRWAAAVLIPVLLLVNIGLELSKRPLDNLLLKHVYEPVEVVAMNGTKVFYTLPDSSTVWLRSGTRLVYDKNMLDAKERRVQIEGEAYFDIYKNPEKPFYVGLKNLDVRVTGTEFNCSTDYQDALRVTLTEGHVEMQQRLKSGKTVLASLTPGQYFSYDTKKNSFKVQEIDVRKQIGWKDNYMLFDNDLMSDVVENISHWYGVEIILKDKEIANMRFTAHFEDLRLNQVIDILELSSNLSSTYHHGKIDKNGNVIKDKWILELKK